jgi:hypothetical protein
MHANNCRTSAVPNRTCCSTCYAVGSAFNGNSTAKLAANASACSYECLLAYGPDWRTTTHGLEGQASEGFDRLTSGGLFL